VRLSVLLEEVERAMCCCYKMEGKYWHEELSIELWATQG
jgi:hypothetical protein